MELSTEMEYPGRAQVKGTQGKSVRAKDFHSKRCLGEMLTGPRRDFFSRHQAISKQSIEQVNMSQLWDFIIASWPAEAALVWKK